MDKLCEFLREKGVSPSIQRLKILRYLKDSENHPTALMIHHEISRDIPTLSKTTIYNTMNLFSEKGIVSELCVGEGEVRYDLNLYPHAHFRCAECGKIYDVKIDPELFKIKKINGNQVVHTAVYFTGKCRECFGKDKENL